jgi:hypothetical protein
LGVQLNIKSAEARALALEVAKLSGQNVTQTIIDALRKRKHELTSEERLERMKSFIAKGRELYSDEDRAFDYDGWLYDEVGLPK